MKSPTESSLSLRARLGRSAPGRYLRALSSSARLCLGVLGTLIVAIAGLSAFSNPPVQVEGEPAPIPVVVQAAAHRALAPEIHVFGRVENPNTTTLRASTLAYVAEVKVREGQEVATGDVLLRLDDRDAQLAVQRAEAALIEARGELDRLLAEQAAEVKNAANQRQLLELTIKKQERFRTLFSNGQIAATDYDALEQQRLEMEMALNQQDMLLASHEAQRAGAQARVTRAEADWQESRLNLERLTLRAPFDGTIIRVDAAQGARLTAGQEVVTLFDAASQQVRVSLPERDARTLRDAQAQGAQVQAVARVSEQWIPIALLEVGSQVRSGRAGSDVLFAAPGDSDLALGRAVDVKITLPAQDDLIEVPLQGVYADRFVYTIEDGVLQAVDVERVGLREDADGNTRLLLRAPGLRDGDPVVVSALSRATSGTRVSPLDSAATSDSLAANEAVALR